MRIVRHYERQAQLVRKLADLSVDRSLLRNAVILQFQIKALWAEDLRIFARSLLCCIQVFLHDCLRDTARKAC